MAQQQPEVSSPDEQQMAKYNGLLRQLMAMLKLVGPQVERKEKQQASPEAQAAKTPAESAPKQKKPQSDSGSLEQSKQTLEELMQTVVDRAAEQIHQSMAEMSYTNAPQEKVNTMMGALQENPASRTIRATQTLNPRPTLGAAQDPMQTSQMSGMFRDALAQRKFPGAMGAPPNMSLGQVQGTFAPER